MRRATSSGDELPHEGELPVELGPPPGGPPLVWSLPHPTAERPQREGGAWIGMWEAFRWARYGWVGACALWVICWALGVAARYGDLGAPLAGCGFLLGTLAVCFGVLDLGAPLLASWERQWVLDRLSARVPEEWRGHLVGAIPVGVIHDSRPEWPPGSFADSYGFLRVEPESLTICRASGLLGVPRDAVLSITPARYVARKGRTRELSDARTPCVAYRASGVGGVRRLTLEHLAGPSPMQVASASSALFERLRSWFAQEAEADGTDRRGEAGPDRAAPPE